MSPKNKRKAFTLIELMIVISIIGVLAAIAIPNFRNARYKANKQSCHATQRTILGAIEMYNLDTGENMIVQSREDLAKLVKERYLQSVPEDPGCRTGKDNFQSDAVGNVWCKYHGTHLKQVIEGAGSGDVQVGDGHCEG